MLLVVHSEIPISENLMQVPLSTIFLSVGSLSGRNRLSDR